MLCAAWILLAAAGPDEDVRLREGEARYLAADARARCREMLADLDGIGSVNVAGTGTDYRLILIVRDARTQAVVRGRLGGDLFDNHRILWCVSTPGALPPAPPPAPAPAAAAPFAAPTLRAPALAAPTACAPPSRPARPATPAPVELRRTFYAGPMTVTPTRRYDGNSRWSHGWNCAPSRYGMIGGGYCPPRACSTPYGGGSSACAPAPAPTTTCGTRPGLAVGQNCPPRPSTPPSCGMNRPGGGRPPSSHGRPAVGGGRPSGGGRPGR